MKTLEDLRKHLLPFGGWYQPQLKNIYLTGSGWIFTNDDADAGVIYFTRKEYEDYCMNKMPATSHHPVHQPNHYTNHPSGIECITITEHMGFNLGNALKYIWRCDLKQDAIEDLEKARWYIEREINKRSSK